MEHKIDRFEKIENMVKTGNTKKDLQEVLKSFIEICREQQVEIDGLKRRVGDITDKSSMI